MSDSSERPTAPEGLPEEIATTLSELRPEELRKTIIHAQELLRFYDESDSLVEPGPNEDILRTTEHEGYTEVVKQFSCAEGCDECPHGPYLYHVSEEPRPEGGTHLKWRFIGPVVSDEE
jgi:hypothetical protein